MNEMPGLGEIGGPEYVVGRCTGAVVRQDCGGCAGFQERRIPAVACRNAADDWRSRYGETVGRVDPVQERPPDRLRRVLVETLEFHSDVEPVAPTQGHRFSPLGIKKVLRVETDEP